MPIEGSSAKPLPDDTLLAEAVMNGGMVTVIDPADLKSNQFQLVKNARIRFDKTSRRPGKTAYGPTKPTSTSIKKLFGYRKDLVTNYRLRFTELDIYYTDEGSWTQLTGDLNNDSDDFYTIAQVEEILVFVNNGKNRIQKIDLDAGTFSDLGEVAPFAKCVTGFSNRVFAANLGDTLEAASSGAWSGDLNFTEFDGAVDPSAGISPITEGAKDIADPFVFVQGFTSVMAMVRENSLWLCTKIPSATNPFNFYQAVPGYGTTAPNSCTIGKQQLIIFDPRSKNCFAFKLDGSIEEIGTPIEDQFLDNVDNPMAFQGEYSKFFNEYYLRAEGKLWTFNFNTKAWQYDEIEDVSHIAVVDVYSPYTSIDDLTGTIDDLVGTIDDLSVTPVAQQTLMFGYENGDVTIEDEQADDDNGDTYDFEVRSKKFQDSVDIGLSQMFFSYKASLTGTLTLQYTKNDGSTWVTAKSWTLLDDGIAHDIYFKRHIKARSLVWRLVASDGLFDLLRYEIYVNDGGETRDE